MRPRRPLLPRILCMCGDSGGASMASADGCTPNEGCMTHGSGGEPEDSYAELLSYRGGIGRKLDNPCAAVPASHLMKFTNMFDEHGHLGDVCAGDYAPFFAEALPIIDEACVNWVPPQ